MQYLLTDDLTVAFDAKSAYWLDAAALDTPFDEATSIESLQQALIAYRGDLLPGFSTNGRCASESGWKVSSSARSGASSSAWSSCTAGQRSWNGRSAGSRSATCRSLRIAP